MQSVYNTLPKNIKIEPYKFAISFDLLTDANNNLLHTFNPSKDYVDNFSYLTNRFIFENMKTLYFSNLPENKPYVGLVTYDLKRSMFVITYYSKISTNQFKLIVIYTNESNFSTSSSVLVESEYNTPKSHTKPNTLQLLIDNLAMGILYNQYTFNKDNTELIYVSKIGNVQTLPNNSTSGGARKYRSKKANKNKRCKASKTKKLRGGG